MQSPLSAEILGMCLICCLSVCLSHVPNMLAIGKQITNTREEVLKIKPGIGKGKHEATNTLSLRVRVKVCFLWTMEKRLSI